MFNKQCSIGYMVGFLACFYVTSLSAQDVPQPLGAGTVEAQQPPTENPALMGTWQAMIDGAGPLPPKPGDYADDPSVPESTRLENIKKLAHDFENMPQLHSLNEPYRFLVTRLAHAGALNEAEALATPYLKRQAENNSHVAEILYRLAMGHGAQGRTQQALNWLVVAEDRVLNGKDILVSFYRTEEFSNLITEAYKELGQGELAFEWHNRITAAKWQTKIDAATQTWDEKKNTPAALGLAEVYREKKDRALFDQWRKTADKVIRTDWEKRAREEPGTLAAEARMLSQFYEGDKPDIAKRWKDITVGLVQLAKEKNDRDTYLAQADMLKTEWEEHKNPFAAMNLAIAYSLEDPVESHKWRGVAHKHVAANYKFIKPQEMVLLAEGLAFLYKKDNPKMSKTWADMIPGYKKLAEQAAVTGAPNANVK